METLVAERVAFDFVVVLLQLETVVDCFVACPCSGFANKYINQIDVERWIEYYIYIDMYFLVGSHRLFV